MGIARVSSSGPRASCLALPPRPLPGPSLSREDPSDTTATAPCPVVASASHRSRAPCHPRDPGERSAQRTRPRRAAGTRDALLPGDGGELRATEYVPEAQIGQRDGIPGPARSTPQLPAPIAGGFVQRGRRDEKARVAKPNPPVPGPSASREASTYPERAREPE